MEVWYYDIPRGIYTIEEVMSLARPKQTYHAVYHAFRRLGVESFKPDPSKANYNLKNEKRWKWKGAKFYLKMKNKSKEEK